MSDKKTPKITQTQKDRILEQMKPENKIEVIMTKFAPQIRRGRPLKYTVEYVDKMITEYIAFCHEIKRDMFGNAYTDDNGDVIYVQHKPFTLEGFCSFICWDRDTFGDYEIRAEFAPTLKNFRELVRSYAVDSLFTSSKTAGVIFNLKNNWGWVDKSVTENTNVNVNDVLNEQDKEDQIDV
jgi:DNA-packaging protein gp3